MKRAVLWTIAIGGMSLGGIYLAQALAETRGQMRRGLQRAETITTRTRQALEETERALQDVRQTI